MQKTQAELRTKLKNPPTRTKQLKSLPTGVSTILSFCFVLAM
ncbi:unnamed protein product [Trichobilharzia regenti]|nr:unnamed protein product [Trichobilharzia regenti]